MKTWVFVMRIGLLILTLVAQPIWWIGLIREWWTSNRRIKKERRTFGSAVYSDKYEVRHFILLSLSLGCLLSLVTFGLGVTVPLTWLLIYLSLALIVVLIGPAAGLSTTILIGSVVLYDLVKYFDVKFDHFGLSRSFGVNFSVVPVADLVIFVALAFIGLGIWVRFAGGRFAAPKVLSQQRGKLVAGYTFNELLVVPTLILVPGDWITSHLSFWPVLAMGHTTVTPLFIPLILGLRLTIFKQQPRIAERQLARHILVLGLIAVVLGLVTLKLNDLAVPGLLVIYLAYLGCLIWTRWRDRTRSFWFSKVDHGVRVLGIKPGTPAAKMAISVGDIITECNRQAVNSEQGFYEALLINPTYCRLKIQTPEGDYKVTETAIFDGAPHEIGIVMFKN